MGDQRRTKAELADELEELQQQLELLRKQVAELTADPERDALASVHEALRESESRLLRISWHATDVISELDAEGRFLFISPNCEEILGRPAESIIGRSIRDGVITEDIHPEDHEALLRSFVETTGVGTNAARYRFRSRNGGWQWYESCGRTFQVAGDETRTVVISRNVTQQVEAEKRLRDSEERYRALLDSTYDLVAELDEEGRLIFLSPSCREILGYEPGELIGTTPFGLVHPDDVERLAQLFLERVDSPRPQGAGDTFRVLHRDGQWRWLQGGGVNHRTIHGERRIVAVCRDATGPVKAEEERRRLEAWMQQAQMFESLGLMAGGVAHDFNNLLTPILGDASLALMELPPDSPSRERLKRIQRAAHHAAVLTNQLLDYAGKGTLAPEPLDLSSLVRETGRLLDSSVGSRMRLVYETRDGLPSTQGDPTQLSRVVMNLITNAIEAVAATASGAGSIAVRTGTVQLDAPQLANFLLGEGLAEGRYVYCEVEDDGAGMDPETRTRIFDPFFTTKFTGRGLGLAAVIGIVRRHRGALDVESQRDRGTRIRVLLPAHGESVAEPHARAPEAEGWRPAGTVLVADDDEGAREFVAETLARAGFEVLTASDGEQAIEIFRSRPDSLRLVLLDRTMPGISGEETLDGIHAIQPDARIVLVSGYSEESTARAFAGRSISGFLQKPFLPETLLEKAREALDD